jgi:hypothetical protein
MKGFEDRTERGCVRAQASEPETSVLTNFDEERWIRCLPETIMRIDISQEVDVCQVTLSASHGPEDSFILSVTTTPYRWTGGLQLTTVSDLANPG